MPVPTPTTTRPTARNPYPDSPTQATPEAMLAWLATEALHHKQIADDLAAAAILAGGHQHPTGRMLAHQHATAMLTYHGLHCAARFLHRLTQTWRTAAETECARAWIAEDDDTAEDDLNTILAALAAAGAATTGDTPTPVPAVPEPLR